MQEAEEEEEEEEEEKEEEECVGVGDVTATVILTQTEHNKSTCLLLLLLDKRLIFPSYAVLFSSAVFAVSSQTVRQPNVRPNLLYSKQNK